MLISIFNRVRDSCRGRFFTIVSGAIGFLTPLLPVEFTSLWGLIPLVVMESSSRLESFLMSFSFYLLFSRGIILGAYIFFRDGSLIRAVLLWGASSFALSLPAFLCFPTNSNSKINIACKTFLMLLLPVIPPLGLIGWGTPLACAGILFPDTAWGGLVLLVCLYIIAGIWRSFRLCFMALILLCCSIHGIFIPVLHSDSPADFHAYFHTYSNTDSVEVKKIDSIQGVNLSLGRLASGSGDFDAQYERERTVFATLQRKNRAGELKAPIIVLPETVTGQLYPTTRRRWKNFLAKLDPERVFIIGGEIPRETKYDNVMVAFNTPDESTAFQRCPVPFSMYRPFSDNGANSAILSRGKNSILEINGQKLGVLICYEQFLAWPLFTLMTLAPDVLIAPANFWWCKDTSLPQIRNITLSAFALLFDVPIISAVNS